MPPAPAPLPTEGNDANKTTRPNRLNQRRQAPTAVPGSLPDSGTQEDPF